MREVKIRVWGEREKEMFYPDDEMLTFYNESKRINYRDIFSHFKHRYKKMLYTGAKDKNGKKIYEGDIVEYTVHMKYRFVVKFENGCFIAGNLSVNQPKNIKVIGNKYENPELIENA